jgi:transposase
MRGTEKTQGVCRELLDDFDALWTFSRIEGVEPTNNRAERDLRPAVQVRKVTSLRLQGRVLMACLTESFHAFRLGSTGPALVQGPP